MHRLIDWPQRLAGFYARTMHLPFAWSTHDCAAWPVAACDAMCGTERAAELAGQYDSMEAAAAWAQARGWATLGDAAVQWYGATPLPSPLFAQRGDLVLMPPRQHAPDGVHAPVLGALALQVDGSCYVVTVDGLRRFTLQQALRLQCTAYALARVA